MPSGCALMFLQYSGATLWVHVHACVCVWGGVCSVTTPDWHAVTVCLPTCCARSLAPDCAAPVVERVLGALTAVLSLHPTNRSLIGRCMTVYGVLVSKHSHDLSTALHAVLPLLRGVAGTCPRAAKRGLECLVRIGEQPAMASTDLTEAVRACSFCI